MNDESTGRSSGSSAKPVSTMVASPSDISGGWTASTVKGLIRPYVRRLGKLGVAVHSLRPLPATTRKSEADPRAESMNKNETQTDDKKEDRKPIRTCRRKHDPSIGG